MAVETITQIKTYFETGDKPTQTQFENLIDTLKRPYKVYTALLTQAGTNAPTAVILENTLSAPIVWTRSSAGVYLGTLTGAFDVTKTAIFIQNTYGVSKQLNLFAYYNDNDTIYIETVVSASVAISSDDELINTSIEIRVYD